MAIDPRDYRKYSGRTGDPHARLGAALAGADQQKARTAEAKGRMSGGHVVAASYYYRWVFGVVLSLAVLVAILLGLL
jgi:hypothetical protein